MQELRHKIRELRTARGLTLKEVASKAGISISFLSDIEHGRSMPSVETLESIATALGVSSSDLIDNRKNPTETIEAALRDNPELLEFWRELSKREDLQLLFKQVRDLSPASIKRVVQVIKLIEEKEEQES